ncbi:uncharacterized protein MYCFIDRAFT_171355 [Pseudocercospora fijiensis CIRAD86]|uniref:Uncharacterized protein n=1 Tax=Pseudocercospora fijiensis (strain CIRAD86) TaxID=383855 RepID=M3A2N4_PSEFD|nr:uncharacterized protein MYCFIDRAFT_171355 [Pseudocercospora fijiensis CIRAD86]EME85429.1 hypothetical protein MYCFIDRAFT_171355 [Pseudocercospora fijiensis CIRAD86]
MIVQFLRGGAKKRFESKAAAIGGNFAVLAAWTWITFDSDPTPPSADLQPFTCTTSPTLASHQSTHAVPCKATRHTEMTGRHGRLRRPERASAQPNPLSDILGDSGDGTWVTTWVRVAVAQDELRRQNVSNHRKRHTNNRQVWTPRNSSTLQTTPPTQGEVDNIFSDSPPQSRTNVDDELIQAAFKWLVECPDISVMRVGDSASKEDSTSDADQVAPAVRTALSGRRLVTTLDRIWHAVAGHGVDHSRLPNHDFQLLQAIASHGPSGVLQPVVTKITGQDKRSVPHRTDRLAQNGYIVKEPVVGAGTRTSVLRLARYANLKNQFDMPANQPGLRGSTRPVLYTDRWFDSIIQLLRENHNIMSMSDIWLGLGIAAQKSKHQKQQLARCLRRVAEVGLVRRVSAQLVDRDGKIITTNSSGHQRSAQAIQLLRDPADLDRLIWLKDSAKPRAASREEDIGTDIDEALLADDVDTDDEGENDVVVQVPPANITRPVNEDGDGDNDDDDDDDIDDLDLITDRVPPIWRPEVPLPNLIHDIVDGSGEAGITLSKLAQRTTGLAWRRPMDEVTNHLTDAWQDSQPPHLRHLGLARSTVSTKSARYRYRTVENHQKVTQSSNADSQFDQDSWGFPKIPLKELAGRDGRATLAEGRKGAVVERMRTDDDHMVVQEGVEQQAPIPHGTLKEKRKKATPRRNSSNKSATTTGAEGTASLVKRTGRDPKNKPPIPRTSQMKLAPNKERPDLPLTLIEQSSTEKAEEAMTVDGGTTAGSEVHAPARLPRGPYGMRERLSSTVEPNALLESTPETDITTNESTPQPSSVVKRKNSRRSLPGQPDVPIVRIHEIKEEEYEAFDKWAQVVAEQRVVLEVRSARREKAAEPGSQADVDMIDTADLPQERVAAMKAQIIARDKPGVYMNPPGARKMKAESFVSRGRPRKSLIAVIKSNRLHELNWFQADNTPRFAPKATKRKTARVGSLLEISNEPGNSDSEAGRPPHKRQRTQTFAKINAENHPYTGTTEIGSPQRAPQFSSQVMSEMSAQASGPFAFAPEQNILATDIQPVAAAEFAEPKFSEFGFGQAGLDGAADDMSPSNTYRAQVAPSTQTTDTMQDVPAARERLKRLFSKPGRKSQATLNEIARLQKQLVKAETVKSTPSRMQTGTVQTLQDRAAAPEFAQRNPAVVHRDALPVSQSGQESVVLTFNADAAAIELAKLQSTPGRKSAKALQRMAVLEQKVKEAKEVEAGVQEAALTSELQKLRDHPGRKTPEMLARIAAIVQALQHRNTDGSTPGRDLADPSMNVGAVTSVLSAAAPIQPQPSEQQGNTTDQGIVNGISTPEVPFQEHNSVPQARSTKPQALSPSVQPPASLDHFGTRGGYDTAYINARPEEDFHHVGHGGWAKGFPLPGITQKTAVHGPAAMTAPLADPNIYTPPSLSANDSEEDLENGLVVKLPIVLTPTQQSENVSLQQPASSFNKIEVGQGATDHLEEPTAATSHLMDVDQGLQTGDPGTFGLELVKNPATPLVAANSRPGGAAAEERRQTVLNAIRQCNGVFPGDHELWYVCTTAWRKSHNGQTPARITTEKTIQQLLSDGRLKKYKFSVEAKKGARMVKHVLAEPHVEASSESLLEMQKQMTLAFPKLHLPFEVEVSPELRAEVTKKQLVEKNNGSTTAPHVDSPVAGDTQQPSDGGESLDGPITVQQSAAAAAIDDQKARLKGFANAEALRLHTQQLYRQRQFTFPSKRRKRRRSAISSDDEDTEDDDDEYLLSVQSGQQELQDEIQLDGYKHDLSSALLPTDGLKQLKQAREQERGAFKPKSRAQQPARNLRRPLGSLRTARANPRRKWWEDGTHFRDPSVALLMNPNQLFHAGTGTFSTFPKPSDTALFGPRLRERTLAREDAAWEHLSSQDWAEVVQRANGLQPVSSNVFQSSISDVVKLKVPGDRLAEIVSEPPQPVAGTDDSEDEVRTRTESPFEAPPREATPKRRYKSRKKRARIDQDDLPASDEDFVPGAASPKEEVVLGTPGRVRMPRGGKDMVTRDRHSGPAFKDADRLVIAIALVAAVCGGINQDRLNWALVAHALSFRYEGEFLRRRWSHYVRFRKADVDALRAAILEPFLAAYEKNELPTVNFQDLGNTDWPGLFRWVQETIPLVKHATISEVPLLPPTRKALEENYNFRQSSKLVDQDTDVFFKPIADMKRRELAVAYVHGITIPGEKKQDDERRESMLLAKSWLRAVAMTKQANYNAEKAARKIAALGAKALESAAVDLLDSHVLSQEKKGRQLPGRNYVIHTDVIGQFRRWPSSQYDEHGHLKAVAQSWIKINEYFKTHDHMQLLPVASDPDYLVLTNMCAQGFLRVKPILPEPTNDLNAQGPRLSAWGYGGFGYETKKVDPNVLKYDLVYTKTSGYEYEPGLNPNIPVPLASALVPGEIGPRIPLWVDIHGNLIGDAWSMVLRSLLHLLVYRPGAKAFHMQVAHEHKLWAWEIEMALDWMEKAGIAKRCGSGKEVDGVWKGGWRASGWWYFVVDSQNCIGRRIYDLHDTPSLVRLLLALNCTIKFDFESRSRLPFDLSHITIGLTTHSVLHGLSIGGCLRTTCVVPMGGALVAMPWRIGSLGHSAGRRWVDASSRFGCPYQALRSNQASTYRM